MAADRDAKDRGLAAIVFTDIVGYSALVNRDEAMGLRGLDRHRRLVRKLVSTFGGREIDTAGDSFLLIFASPFAALRAIAAIYKAQNADNARHPEDQPTRLRASLHVGDVQYRGREVFGDGVNVAARLLPMSPQGGLAMSDHAYGQVRHRIDLEPVLLGPQTLKNIRHAVHVFTLEHEQMLVIPSEPRTRATDRRSSWPSIATRWRALAAGTTVVIAAGIAFTLFLGVRGAHSADAHPVQATADAHHSIAVLPFASFSNGSGDELLAYGIQDAVLTNLARIDSLRVTSRTSVMPYRETASRNLKSIAETLGVGAILEGSVQRDGARLLVQVQLIDAATDAHLWAQAYDKQVDDLFEVEGAISRQVAEAVQVHLAAPVVAAMTAKPTENVEAYRAYLQAQKLMDQDDAKLQPQIEQALDRALQLDPKFALARVLLARAYVRAYYEGSARDEAQLLKIRDQLILAAEVQPNLPELHEGWGSYYFYGRHDYEAALAEMQKAAELAPGNAQVLAGLGKIEQERGELREAMIYEKRALAIDPTSIAIHIDVLDTERLLHDYVSMKDTLDAAQRLAPGDEALRMYRAGWLIDSQGDLRAARAAVAGIDVPQLQEKLAYYAGDFDEAIRQVKRQPAWTNQSSGEALYPIEENIAVDLWLNGEQPEAKHLFEKVIKELEAALLKPEPDHSDQLADLAIAYAAVGEAQKARATAKRLDLQTCCQEANARNGVLTAIAFSDLLLNDRDGALDALDALISKPSAVSANLIRLDPAWKSLRDDARFTALLRRASASERHVST